MRLGPSRFGWVSVSCLAMCLSVRGRLVANQPAFEPPDGERAALRLPSDVVTAWEKAGASAGWLGPHRHYILCEFHANRQELAEPRSVPALKIHRWREGILAKLPAPGHTFGLDLSYSSVTDADLKELARLKNLTALDLSFTNVTDAGLKELTGL